MAYQMDLFATVDELHELQMAEMKTDLARYRRRMFAQYDELKLDFIKLNSEIQYLKAKMGICDGKNEKIVEFSAAQN